MKLYEHFICLIGIGLGLVGTLFLIFTYFSIILFGGVIYQEPNLIVLVFEFSGFIVGFICLSWFAWNFYLKGEI